LIVGVLVVGKGVKSYTCEFKVLFKKDFCVDFSMRGSSPMAVHFVVTVYGG